MELGEVVLKFFDLMASTSDWLALNLSDLNHVFLLLLKYLVLNLPNLLLLNGVLTSLLIEVALDSRISQKNSLRCHGYLGCLSQVA